MNQRGFIQLPMMAWGAIAAGAVILSLTGAVYIQTIRLDNCKADHAKFVGGVEALGMEAAKDAANKDLWSKLNKEKADAENAKTHADDRATIKRLRDANPSGSFVPQAPAGSSRPDLACFDRAEYQRTDGIFTEGARGLSDEGTAATVDLNTAKAWAQRAP
jgi:hypothetical protein